MRIRITFSKTAELKYIGHLDLNMIWERAARRAGLPLAYSQGFHPQPKINHASALPLGFSSCCEVVDVRLNGEVDLTELPLRIQTVMPAGIRILKVETVDEKSPPLQTQVIAAEYEMTITPQGDVKDLDHRMAELLTNSSLPRVRRGKAYDLRPLIEELELRSERIIFMRLTAREAATGRPEEVIDALGIAFEDTITERTRLIFQQ